MDARTTPSQDSAGDAETTRSQDELFADIDAVGPRCYSITGLPDGPLHFYVLGCQGENSDRQKAVAELMNTLTKEKRPAFILFLGDNIYGNAVQSALDERFGTHFHQVYALPELQPIPKLLILGNHDAGDENRIYYLNRFFFKAPIINLLTSPYQTGRSIEKYEVAHTYLKKSAAFFQQEQLSLNSLPDWCMPHYFNAYRFESAKTALFCLDSNTYVAEAIDFWTNGSADHSKNQAVFFDQHFFQAERDGFTTLVALHNPLRTASKRALSNKYDAYLYLPSRQIQQMNYILELKKSGGLSLELFRKILTESASDTVITTKINSMLTNGSYADMLLVCFEIQGIKPTAAFAAHDHANVFNCDSNFCQVIAGAGGSTSLMPKMSNQHDANMGCFISEPGFVAVTCEGDKKLTFEYHTTTSKYLKFTNASHVPVETRDSQAEQAVSAAAASAARM